MFVLFRLGACFSVRPSSRTDGLIINSGNESNAFCGHWGFVKTLSVSIGKVGRHEV